MSNLGIQTDLGGLIGVVEIPSTRGILSIMNGYPFERQTLSTDPVKTISLTFSGVVPGSEIRIIDSLGNEAAGIESCVANQVLTLSLYSFGSPSNNVVVRIMSLGYVIVEINITLSDDTTIPVQQRVDRNYLNL